MSKTGSNKQKLQNKFEPVWKEDFQIMRDIGVRAWALRLYMQVICDPESWLIKISELEIQREFGWNPKTTRLQLKTLLDKGYITSQGYLIYYVRCFRRLSTDSVKNTDVEHRRFLPTTSVKTTDPTRQELPTTSVKTTDSIYTESDIQNQIQPPLNNLGGENSILKTVGKDFKNAQ